MKNSMNFHNFIIFIDHVKHQIIPYNQRTIIRIIFINRARVGEIL